MINEIQLLPAEELSTINGGMDLSGLGSWVTDTIKEIHSYGKNLGRQIGEAIW